MIIAVRLLKDSFTLRNAHIHRTQLPIPLDTVVHSARYKVPDHNRAL